MTLATVLVLRHVCFLKRRLRPQQQAAVVIACNVRACLQMLTRSYSLPNAASSHVMAALIAVMDSWSCRTAGQAAHPSLVSGTLPSSHRRACMHEPPCAFALQSKPSTQAQLCRIVTVTSYLVDVRRWHIRVQLDCAACVCCVAVLPKGQVTCDKAEQVAGLWERVLHTIPQHNEHPSHARVMRICTVDKPSNRPVPSQRRDCQQCAAQGTHHCW